MNGSGEVLLKRSLHRVAYVESGTGEQLFVKRFHSAGRLGRLFDRRRARREERMLAAMAERGIRVPRARGVRRANPGWELVTDFVADAASLAELFEGRARWPRPPERVARELGRSAARALMDGLDHRDLHPGNVLIDSEGKAWLVDVAHARLRRAASTLRMYGDLERWAAAARERATIGFRQRFLVAFLRELPTEILDVLGKWLGDRGALAARIEHSARIRRRAVLKRQALRWKRDSSATRAIRHGDMRGWARLDLADDVLGAFLSRLEGTRGSAPPDDALVRETATRRFLFSDPFGVTLLRWLTLAKAEMHGISAPRPLLLLRRPRPILIVDLAADARQVGAGSVRVEEESSEHLAAIGNLLGTLHDRGYRASSDRPWVSDRSPVRASLPPEHFLSPLAPRTEVFARDCRAALRSFEVTRQEARSAFLEGYLRAFRGGRAERERLAQDLRDA